MYIVLLPLVGVETIKNMRCTLKTVIPGQTIFESKIATINFSARSVAATKSIKFSTRSVAAIESFTRSVAADGEIHEAAMLRK